MRHIRKVLSVVALTLLLVVGVDALPASAVGATFHYSSVSGVGCLDASSASRVYVHRCNSGDYQKWYVKYLPNGLRSLRNIHFNQCLDGNSTSIYLNNCNDANEYQQWDDISTSLHQVQYKSKRTAKCMTAPSSSDNRVTAKSCTFGSNQHWSSIG